MNVGFVKKTKKFSKGLVILGIGSAIGAGVAAQAPAGTPSVMGGFSTAASFAPTIGTIYMGGEVLKAVKGLKSKKKVKLF